jgi:hypothetical protein
VALFIFTRKCRRKPEQDERKPSLNVSPHSGEEAFLGERENELNNALKAGRRRDNLLGKSGGKELKSQQAPSTKLQFAADSAPDFTSVVTLDAALVAKVAAYRAGKVALVQQNMANVITEPTPVTPSAVAGGEEGALAQVEALEQAGFLRQKAAEFKIHVLGAGADAARQPQTNMLAAEGVMVMAENVEGSHTAAPVEASVYANNGNSMYGSSSSPTPAANALGCHIKSGLCIHFAPKWI